MTSITFPVEHSHLYPPIQDNERVAIFLDIDGVLIENFMPDSPLHQDINEKAYELFGNMGHKKDFKATPLETRIAAALFLSKAAVSHLEQLIKKVAETKVNISIIISSTWRLGVSAEDLKNKIFAPYSFSKLIIDKTPDRKDRELIETAKINYNLEINNRGGEVSYWLKENKDKLNIKKFLILDDVDSGFSEQFPLQFCHVDHVESKYMTQDIYEKALNLLEIK